MIVAFAFVCISFYKFILDFFAIEISLNRKVRELNFFCRSCWRFLIVGCRNVTTMRLEQYLIISSGQGIRFSTLKRGSLSAIYSKYIHCLIDS